MQRWLVPLIVLTAATTYAQHERRATTVPATTQSVKTSEAAKELVERIAGAYLKLNSLELAGTIRGDFEIAGETLNQAQEFSASYGGPGYFRHQTTGDVLIGGTGDKVYAYAAGMNAYLSVEGKKEKQSEDELPPPVVELLQLQNPSLLLAVVKEPGDFFSRNVEEVSRGENVKIRDVLCATLKLRPEHDAREFIFAVDPATHLIRRVTVDWKKYMEKRGALDVTRAVVSVDYTKVSTEAAKNPEAFAWNPPEGAKDLATMHLPGAEIGGAAAALVGKPAPSFKLAGLDGKEVALESLKGNVVVLDFWATWCGPCVVSMPDLNRLHQEKSGEGVKVLAVNLMESKGVVQAFMTRMKLDVPVLLDQSGIVAEQYGVEGIPQTVVIDKAGLVKKVMIVPDIVEVKAAVEAAMK
jgi:peroxiredoxin/outer membrane lipoprotein-sorting protein